MALFQHQDKNILPIFIFFLARFVRQPKAMALHSKNGTTIKGFY